MQQQETPSFGTLLKRLRVGAGLSQEQLAERARISAQAVGAYERGIRRAPHRDTLVLLVEALDLRGVACDELTAAAERARGRRLSAAGRATDDEPRTNLPPLLSDLIGREDEVARITGLLASYRLVTIVGAGGVGKTRVSLQVGEDLLGRFADGVWFVELAPLTNAEHLATSVAAAMGVKLVAQDDPLAQLGRALKRLQALLVLDNCEHVIDGVAAGVSRLLRECPQLRILASSRQPLEIDGEATFRMPSLALEAAVMLFAERAGTVDDSFALTPENRAIIADICRRLDGIPLAIELAAARVKIFTPPQLARRLDERFQLLTGGRRDVLERQQTLLAAIDWSYQLLDERERALLRRMAVFAGTFTFDGAIAVGHDESLQEFEIVDTLQSLVNKSLVVREARDGEQRFRLLESTRAYAKRLLEPAELEATSQRHLRFFLQGIFEPVAGETPAAINTTHRDAVFTEELEEVRAALDWGVEHDVSEGARLLSAVGASWRRAGLHDEGLRRAQHYASLLPPAEHELAAHLWSTVAYTSCNTDPDLCMTSAERALNEARTSADVRALSVALTAYAHALIRHGKVMQASEALDAHDGCAGPTHHSRFLRATAWALSGDYDSATAFFKELRVVLLGAGDVAEAAVCAQNQAENEHWRGNTEEAVRLVRQAIDEFHVSDDRVSVILCLSNLCGYLAALGRLDEAREAGRQALREGRRLYPEIYSMTNALEHLALVSALELDYETAATLSGYAEAAHEREGYVRERTESATRTHLETALRANVSDPQLSTWAANGASLAADDAVTLGLAGSATGVSLDYA